MIPNGLLSFNNYLGYEDRQLNILYTRSQFNQFNWQDWEKLSIFLGKLCNYKTNTQIWFSQFQSIQEVGAKTKLKSTHTTYFVKLR